MFTEASIHFFRDRTDNFRVMIIAKFGTMGLIADFVSSRSARNAIANLLPHCFKCVTTSSKTPFYSDALPSVPTTDRVSQSKFRRCRPSATGSGRATPGLPCLARLACGLACGPDPVAVWHRQAFEVRTEETRRKRLLGQKIIGRGCCDRRPHRPLLVTCHNWETIVDGSDGDGIVVMGSWFMTSSVSAPTNGALSR